MNRPGWLGRLPMPAMLRGSAAEPLARDIARRVKSLLLRCERTFRRGQAAVTVEHVSGTLRFDFDFLVVNPAPPSDPLLPRLLERIRHDHVVFDVGGFVGLYAIAAARRASRGHVVTFEPAPASATLLRRHCLLNGVADRVRVVEAACSRTNGVVLMPVWPTGSTTWGSGNALRNVYPREGFEPEWIAVSTLRLDDFVQASGRAPDIMKVDVEGGELWVLQGASETLRQHRPTVFLEIHRFAWPLFQTDESAFRTFLEDVGYDLLEVDPPHRAMLSLPDYGFGILTPR